MKKRGSQAAARASIGNISSSSGASFATAASVPAEGNVIAEKDAAQSNRRLSSARRSSHSSRSSRRRREKPEKSQERFEPAAEEPVQEGPGLQQKVDPDLTPVAPSCDVQGEVNPRDGEWSNERVRDGTVTEPAKLLKSVDQGQAEPLETLRDVAQATLSAPVPKVADQSSAQPKALYSLDSKEQPPQLSSPSQAAAAFAAKKHDEVTEASVPAAPTPPVESSQGCTSPSSRRESSAAVDEPQDRAVAVVEASSTLSPTKPSTDPDRSTSRETKHSTPSTSLDRLRKLIEEDMCPLDFSWPNMEVKADQSSGLLRCPRICVLLVGLALFGAALAAGVALMNLLRPRSSPGVSLCLSLECREYALRLAGSLNRSVRPCDSFTRFVCDGWSSEHRLSVRELLVAQAMQTMGRLQTMVYVPKTHQSSEERGEAVYRSCNSLLIGRRDELPAVRTALKQANITWPLRPAKVNVLHTILATSLHLGWDVLLRFVHLWFPRPHLLVNYGRTIIKVLNKISSMQPSKKQAYFTILRENMLEPGILSTQKSSEEVSFQEVSAVEELTATTLRRSYYKPDVPPEAVPDIMNMPELGLSRGVWERTLAVFGLNISEGTVDWEISTANPRYLRAFIQLWKRLGDTRTHLFVSWYTVQVAALYANQALIVNFYDGDTQRALALHSAFCLGHAYAVSGPVVFSSYSRHTLRSTTKDDAGRLTLAVRESFRKRMALWGTHNDHVTVVSNWTSLDSVFKAYGGSDALVPALNTSFADGAFQDMTEHSLVTNLLRAASFATIARRGNSTSDVADTAMSVGISTLRLSATLYERGDFMLMPYSLSFPLYDYQLIPAVNYGGLGAEVARALGQLFIEAYRIPEASRSWINRLEGCLLAAAFTEERDVFMTMAEAVSFGALLDAYEVHESDEGGDNKRLAGLQEFTGRQLLFMALCFMKCRGKGAGKTPPWACNLPLMHMPAFSRTFDCPPGTPMNPINKCQLT